MKKNRSRSYVHDRLYRLASKLLKRHNPCGQCIKTDCYGNGAQRCCNGCPHFGPKGCTVEALYCKLWLCWSLPDSVSPLRARLRRLLRIARKYDLLVARASRDEALAFGKALRDDEWYLHFADDRTGASRERIHKGIQLELMR